MFGGGGGGFGTSGTTGFGASTTPFGSTTGQQQTSAFGGGGTTFGAGATSAFGAKPAFGSSTTGAFGSTTGAFGAKPNVFGAPAAAPATAFGTAAPATSAFGRTTSTTPFGTAAAPGPGAFGATTGAFGAAPAPAPFGAPAPAGGLGGFGSTAAAANPFGKPATGAFGAAPAPAAGGVFGAPAPAAGGFGGFGSSSTATTGGGLFGSTPAPATGAFGAPAPAPSVGLFGAAPATGLSGFGAGTSAFGATAVQKGTGNPSWRETRAEDPTGKAGANPGMLVSISAMKEYEGKSHEELRLEDYLQNRKNSSAVSTAAKGFGAAPAPSTGLFGGFGATPAPAPATGGLSFGGLSAAPAAAPSAFGATFGATTPAPAPGGFGGFGSTTPAPATGLFGAPTPAPAPAFGAPAPAPAPTGGFSFGATAPAPAQSGFRGLFGSTTAPALASGGFTGSTTSAFGSLSSAPAPAPGGFGSSIGGFGAPAPAPAMGAFSFGGAAPAAAGAFGAPAAAPAAGGFGAAGGLFGSTPAAATPASGAFSFKPAAAPTSAASAFSFGGTTNAFGAAPKPASSAFGAPAPSTALFGSTSPAPAPGGLSFGAAAPATAATGGFGGFGSAFGAPAPAPAPTSAFGASPASGLFGAQAAAPVSGGFFGAPAQQQPQQQEQRIAVHNQDPYGSAGNNTYGSGALDHKIKSVENSSQQLAISFERNNAHASGVGAPDHGGGGGQASPAFGFAYRRAPRSTAHIQPRGLGGGGVAATAGKTGGGQSGNGSMPPPSSSRLLSEGALTPSGKSGVLSPDVYLSGGVKRLNIPQDTEEWRTRYSAAKPLIRPATSSDDDGNGNIGGSRGSLADSGARAADAAAAAGGGSGGGGVEETKSEPSHARTPEHASSGDVSAQDGHKVMILASPDGSSRRDTRPGGLASPPPSGGVGTDVRAAAGGADESLLDASPAGGTGRLFDDGHGEGLSAAPRLDAEGYETTPSISELTAMGEDALRSVSGFVVSRRGVGSIAWKEPVDLRRVDIASVVAIEHKSVAVYDDLAEGEEKPALGQGLNKPTTVTLFDVFPKGDEPSEDQKGRYEARVRKNTEKMGAKLVEYDVETGIWVFETFHWSRYSMDDSDNDEGEGNGGGGGVDDKPLSAKLMPPPPPVGPMGKLSRVRGPTPAKDSTKSGSMPRRSTKYSMPDTDDEGSIADNASDAGGMTAVAYTRSGDEETKAAVSGGEDAKMVDFDHPGTDSARGNGAALGGYRRGMTSNLFSETGPSNIESMQSFLFSEEERAAAAQQEGSRANGVDPQGTSAPSTLSSAWLPLPPPLRPRQPALGNTEDAEAAKNFRPAVADAESSVLRLLAKAWEPTPGEMTDGGKRGVIRAGRSETDLGLRMGRGFGASWGPGGKLVCPGSIGGGGTTGYHAVRVLQFDPTPATSGRDVEALYVSPLLNHLRFARPVREEGCGGRPPRWGLPKRRNDNPDNYASLVRCMHGYADAHASAGADSRVSRNQASEDSPEWVLEQLWRLASAMWGQEEGEGRAQDLPMPGETQAIAECEGASPTARRDAAVADWLADAVAACVPARRPVVRHELAGKGSADGADQEIWRRVLELLSVRRVEEAAETAMVGGLPRLAVILTAAASEGVRRSFVGPQASAYLALQATLWQGGGADARMPQEAFTVYQLLGREGFRDVRLRGVIGKESDSLHPSLDWLRQLGLCMWFGAGALAGSGGVGTVADAFEAYESLVAEDEALSPTARYFRDPTHHDKADLDQVCKELRRVHVGKDRARSVGGTTSGRDRCVLNRLLAMYPSRNAGGGASGVALLAALEPMAVTPDVMDYRHSWHLMSVVEALGVAEVPNPVKSATIAEALQCQLVCAGLWEWAVYVALTSGGDPDRREATARELVLRHGFRLLEASEASRRSLLEQLEVPTTWFHEAAAIRAGYDHQSALQTPYEIDASTTTRGAEIEEARETKLRALINSGSKTMCEDAAREACSLAPGSMFLGGSSIENLATLFRDVMQQLERAETEGGGGDPHSKEFDAYKEILEAATVGRPASGSGGWGEEEIERLERVRRVVQPAAARVVGPAVAHEALNTLWREAGIVAVV